MKFIASILILYFSVLIAMPVGNMGPMVNSKTDNNHTGSMHCKGMATQHSKAPVKQNAGTCGSDLCNPFIPCGLSMAYNLPIQHFENRVLELTKDLQPAINDVVVSDYLSDCWHPPQLS